MKFSKGITLISLVITIIVMLIIAGVVIANTLGNNSSIEKAEKAKLTEEQRSKKDTLEHALIKFNSGNVSGGKDLRQFLLSELDIEETVKNDEGVDVPNIARFTDLNGEYSYLIKDYQGEMAYLTIVDGIWQIEKFGVENLGYVASLDDNDVLIAPRSGDELDIVSSTDNYAIITSDDLEDVSFDIPAYTTVSIKLLSNLNITNEGLKRAAINLNEGSVLNLTIEGNVTVNSTLGEDANGAVPGKGGYAGIRVPTSATLRLNGSGTITAIGGNAGNGPTYYGIGGVFTAGGGGAGAGIGGNGGNGSAGLCGQPKTIKVCPDGGNGENCGTVEINGSLKVYAYGGAGGAGGSGGNYGQTGAGGAGGYPAAGIGGGGAGGAGSTCCAGAGGFTAGSASGTKLIAQNGLAGFGYGRNTARNGESPLVDTYKAGGYFEGPKLTIKGFDMRANALGGYAGVAYAYKGHEPGFGGKGGAGGTVLVSSSARVFAYNGSYITTGNRKTTAANQCPIYAQSGIKIAKYKTIYSNNESRYNDWTIVEDIPQGVISKSGYINNKNGTKNLCSELGATSSLLQNIDMKCQGVGSGAGYIEESNGTYRTK